MDPESIQSPSPTSSRNVCFQSTNRPISRRPNTNVCVVPVEGVPRSPSTASSSSKSAKMKIARRLNQAGLPSQHQQQNQQASLPSCSKKDTIGQDLILKNHKKQCKDFDDVMEKITKTSYYQKTLLYFVISPIAVIQPILAFNTVFMLFSPEHWCTSPNRAYYDDPEEYKLAHIPMINGTDGLWKYASCSMYGPYRSELKCFYGWEYDKTYYQQTMVSEYGWVCEKGGITTLIFLAGTIGNAVGILGFGLLSDSWGRKPTLFLAILTNVIFRVLSLFCGNYVWLLCATQFILGCTTTVLFVIPSLIAAELCNKDERAEVYAITWTVCLVGLSILPFIAWLCGHWFYIGLSTAGLGALMLFYYPLVPESPRWLLQKGRVDEAAAVLKVVQDYNKNHAEAERQKSCNKNQRRKANMINTKLAPAELQKNIGRRFSSMSVTSLSSIISAEDTVSLKYIQDLLFQVLDKQYDREESISIASGRGAQLEDRSKATVIFTRRNMAKNTCLLAVCWSMNALIYSTMTYNSIHMSGSHFKNFFLLGIIEVTSGFVGGYLTDTLGRRWTQTGAFGLCSLACFATSIMVHQREIEILLATLAKMLVTVSYLVVFCMTTELFPTELRSTGSGIVSTIGNFACIWAPIISELSSVSATYPWLIMAALALIGMVAAAFLPETLYLGLPETIEEANAIGKNRNFWSIRTGNERNIIKTSKGDNFSST